MRPRVSFFDQAADTLRQAIEGQVSAVERTRLIHEALELYHRHQLEEAEDGPDVPGPPDPPAASNHA